MGAPTSSTPSSSSSGWLALVVGVLTGGAVAALMARWTLARKRRHIFAPLWLALMVALASPWRWAGPFWAAAAFAGWWQAVRPAERRWKGRTALSQREWIVLTLALVAAALWSASTQLVAADRAVFAAAWVVLAGVGTGTWWWGRRTRKDKPTEAELVKVESTTPHPLVEVWPRLVEAEPKLAGDWDWTPGADTGILRLHSTSAAAAVRLQDDVERILNVIPGTIRLSRRRSLPARSLVVSVVTSVVAKEGEIAYWEGPTLEDTGRRHLTVGRTLTGKNIKVPLLRANGASHFIIIAGSGNGKGVTARLLATEFALSDWIYPIALDGKGGQGFPEIRDGMTLYLREPEDIQAAIRMVAALSDARKRRYGDLGASGWVPSLYEPMIVVLIDEVHELSKIFPKDVNGCIETLAAQGRSNGVSLVLISQRADGDSLVSTKTRNNVRANGTAFIGKFGDSVASSLGSEGFDVDPMDLPVGEGWFYVLSHTAPAEEPEGRISYIPSSYELEARDDEVVAPMGSVEEIMARAIFPELHPEDQAIVDRFFPPDVLAAEANDLDPELPGVQTLVLEPPQELPTGYPQGHEGDSEGDISRARAHGLAVTTPGVPIPRSVPVDNPEADDEALEDRIVALLIKEPRTRGALADALGISPRHVSRVLARLQEQDRAEPIPGGTYTKWRPAP